MESRHSIYAIAGGDEPFHRLVDGFYARIEVDALLRPMFPEDMAVGKLAQFLFLTQYFGGPTRYQEYRGHPRLRMRHSSFRIGLLERDRWVAHMLASLEEAGFPAEVLPEMRTYFERAGTHMINVSDDVPGADPRRIDLG